MSFLVPNLQLLLGENEQRIAYSFWWRSGNTFFLNWGQAVLCALVFSTAHSWLSGLVVKKMSSVMKLLGKCASVALVYFVGDCWLLRKPNEEPPVVCTVTATTVVLGTYTFVSVKPEKPKDKPTSEAEA